MIGELGEVAGYTHVSAAHTSHEVLRGIRGRRPRQAECRAEDKHIS
jgi:hypothetical protein